MMAPSALESINVDWTPGFDASRERFSNVDEGYYSLILEQNAAIVIYEQPLGSLIMTL